MTSTWIKFHHRAARQDVTSEDWWFLVIERDGGFHVIHEWFEIDPPGMEGGEQQDIARQGLGRRDVGRPQAGQRHIGQRRIEIADYLASDTDATAQEVLLNLLTQHGLGPRIELGTEPGIAAAVDDPVGKTLSELPIYLPIHSRQHGPDLLDDEQWDLVIEPDGDAYILHEWSVRDAAGERQDDWQRLAISAYLASDAEEPAKAELRRLIAEHDLAPVTDTGREVLPEWIQFDHHTTGPTLENEYRAHLVIDPEGIVRVACDWSEVDASGTRRQGGRMMAVAAYLAGDADGRAKATLRRLLADRNLTA